MLIGRKRESKVLLEAVEQDQSQLIAVYGRRRIGKTYLIRETFQNNFAFQHAGAYNRKRGTQLYLFYQSMIDAGLSSDQPQPQNWFEAFTLLKRVIQLSTQKKKILFIDELSWMDTPKSDLIPALEHFWNAWASARKDIVLILCSSATSWILNKVIHNKGGLYNRLTKKIQLMPFSLAQCKAFAEVKQLMLSDTQIMELYMALGGIPYYWDQLQKGFSVPQNMDVLFFSPGALLAEEYDYLFASIFRNPEPYEKIIQALAGKKMGLSRNELLEKTGLAGSGTSSRYLRELASCGFIREYKAFGKQSKDALFQLIDPFVLFHHHFMGRQSSAAAWINRINTPAVNAWMGLSFELVCLLHTDQIKKKLGIQGILTEVSSFQCRQDPESGIRGSQIDLVIRRADRIIDLLEMKYTQGPYTITKGTDEDLRRKMMDFRIATKCRETTRIVMVTPFGLTRNSYAGNIQAEITAEDLFLNE